MRKSKKALFVILCLLAIASTLSVAATPPTKANLGITSATFWNNLRDRLSEASIDIDTSKAEKTTIGNAYSLYVTDDVFLLLNLNDEDVVTSISVHVTGDDIQLYDWFAGRNEEAFVCAFAAAHQNMERADALDSLLYLIDSIEGYANGLYYQFTQLKGVGPLLTISGSDGF